ncbi:hypothetical protein EVAR_17882_1 [Eumeta japonica]|uniref:Uncharacterized protein n=1 Tax=Eumeta variegata TaxID=151549 RepID=A0A4C1V025_EUMVA|nr:hypothetical protein EVAR_17882_1 [Eumeta japonica]
MDKWTRMPRPLVVCGSSSGRILLLLLYFLRCPLTQGGKKFYECPISSTRHDLQSDQHRRHIKEMLKLNMRRAATRDIVIHECGVARDHTLHIAIYY